MRARSFVGVAVAAAAVLTAGCAGPSRAPGPARLSDGGRVGSAVELVSTGLSFAANEPGAAARVAGAEVDFALRLLRQLDTNDAGNVTTQTAHKITKLVNPADVDPTTQLVLANAVHFLAGWQSPFDPVNSQPGLFYGPGGPATATYMEQSLPGATITSSYREVRLPYAGGRFQAVAIMPEGQNLNTFVRFPRFTTTTHVNLNNTLSALGMPLAFGLQADFSAMSPIALHVQSVVQRDYLSVGEKGTEAAAATGISVLPTAAHVFTGPAITLDHPFLFLIRDTNRGTILFSSLIKTHTGG
jgi:serine protease inhibitor